MKTDFDDAYSAKLRVCNKEALITVAALAATVVVWAACGFGLSGVDMWVLGMPLWAVTGTVGTWLFAVVVAVVLSRHFFCDFDTDEYESPSYQTKAEDAACSSDAGDMPSGLAIDGKAGGR